MDPNNPIVQLCAAGMAAEGEGRGDAARALFEQAWAASGDDYEACIAAHYLARHQPTALAELDWNRIALERATRAGDGRVQPLYASLHLNLAHSLERVGHIAAACEHYARAQQHLERLGASPYANLVRAGVAAGQARACRGST